MKSGILVCFLLVAAAVLCTEVHSACNVNELSPCLGAVVGGGTPSADCCAKLRQQKPCFCGYLKNPNLRQYIPGAKRVASQCGVGFPGC